MDEDLDLQLNKMHNEGRHHDIIKLILSLPDDSLDDDIKGLLAVAYNNVGNFDSAIETLNSLNERLKRLCPGEIDTLQFNHFIIFEAALNRLSDDDCKELIRQIALDKIRRSIHTYNYRLEKLTKLETDLTK